MFDANLEPNFLEAVTPESSGLFDKSVDKFRFCDDPAMCLDLVSSKTRRNDGHIDDHIHASLLPDDQPDAAY